ncbi:MAG: DUF5916 domain-containing protein [Bacteroidota bacterium]
MTKQLTLLFCCALVCAHLNAQKTFQIPKLEQIPTLDGIADDDCWQKAGVADGFTTSTPVFGQTPAHPVSVRMFYADDALYIAATCGADKLRDDGSARDAFAGDWFSVSFDTWNDDQHAFSFTVTAANTKIDEQVGGGQLERNWDAVWQSAVARTAEGWSVEIRIPITALRFPKGSVQNWGLQFSRYDIQAGQLCAWNPLNPLISDKVIQYGNVAGLENIRQAKRRKIYGYSNNVANYTPKKGQESARTSIGNAMAIDGQIGFGSNSTLDVTLLPGSSVNTTSRNGKAYWNLFGDNNGAGVTPRQFNAESNLLFNQGEIVWQAPYFYTTPRLLKRLGEIQGPFYISEYPRTRLLNAAKFSTRTRQNYGFGIYNVLFGPTNVKLKNYETGETSKRNIQPLTNYTMLTAEKVLRNNSWVNFSNSTLLAGKDYRTNISALDFQLRDRSNRYEIAGNGNLAFYDLEQNSTKPPAQYHLSIAKINGPLVWRVEQIEKNSNVTTLISGYDYFSPKQRYNVTTALIGFRDFTPGKHYLNRSIFFTAAKSSSPFVNLSAIADVRTHKFQHLGAVLYSSVLPFRKPDGPKAYPNLNVRVSFESDARKRFFYRLAAQSGGDTKKGVKGGDFSFRPTWVISRHFSLQMDNDLSIHKGYLSYINQTLPNPLYIQYNKTEFDQGLSFNWFANEHFRMYVQCIMQNELYSKQRVVQLNQDESVTPLDDAFSKYKNGQKWIANFGLQYLLESGSQLRFNTAFGHTKQNVFNNVLGENTLDSKFEETSATLTIILLIDPTNKRNFVGHE